MNRADKLIIVIHEIYGLNVHIKSYCSHLEKLGYEVSCPNLLKIEQPFPYEQEEEAYQYFMNEIGFLKSRNKIKEIIKDNRKNYKKVYLLGFSVGATIAWLCSGDGGVNGVVGYYGSRIRNYTEIQPACPVLLFFPETEEAFHVGDLIPRLIEKKVEVHKLEGAHGFSDPFSSKYNQQSAEEAMRMLADFLYRLG